MSRFIGRDGGRRPGSDTQQEVKTPLELMEKRFLVLVGNYGSGKTELALNRALEFAAEKSTTLVDLDIVNPYFRSGEKADMLREGGHPCVDADIRAFPRWIFRRFLRKFRACLSFPAIM